MALEKVMGTMLLKTGRFWKRPYSFWEGQISSFSSAGFVKDQEARSSFAGFGKDHHAVCQKVSMLLQKILIGS